MGKADALVEFARLVVLVHGQFDESGAFGLRHARQMRHQRPGAAAPALRLLDEEIVHEQRRAVPAGKAALFINHHADNGAVVLRHQRGEFRPRAEAVAPPVVLARRADMQ